MTHRPTAALLAVAVLLLAAAPAAAQDAANRAAAETLFAEGVRLLKKKQVAEACPKFEESLKLVDGLGTRGKLAECYEKADRLASAWGMYREVASLAARRGERDRQREAEKRAAALEPRLSYLTLSMPSPPVDVSITVNGRDVGVGALGTPIPVDRGPQTIVVAAKGFHDWTQTTEVASKQKVTVEVPPLEALPPEPAPAAPTPATPLPAPPETVIQAPTARDDGAPRWRRPTGIALVAGGAVALGAGLVFGAIAKSKWDQAFDDGHCNSDNVCTERGIELTDQAHSRATTATVLTVSGLVLAGAGIAIWVWPSSGGDRGDGVALTPGASSDGGELVLSGRF